MIFFPADFGGCIRDFAITFKPYDIGMYMEEGVGYNLDGCPNSTVLPGEVETCKASLEAHVYNGSDLETADTGLRTFTRTFSSTLLVMITTAIFKIDNINKYSKKTYIHTYIHI